MHSIEENKWIARQWLDLVSARQVEALCSMTAPSWTMRGGPPNLPSGPDGVRALFQTIGPVDQPWTVEEVSAEGDRVVVRATTRAQGSSHRIDAGGTRQASTATFTFRIADGKVLETWRNVDDLDRLFELGARIVPGTSEQ